MSRIFVTGGSGFIGTNLLQSLLEEGNDVINYDIRSPRNITHNQVWHRGDVLDMERLSNEVEIFKPQLLVHLAARTDLNGKNISDYAANTDGVTNIVNTVAECKSLERVLFTSSRLVCHIGYSPKSDIDYCPTTFYGESKVIGENIIRKNQNNVRSSWAILRPTSIWGPWFDTPYKEFFLSILNSHYFHPKGKRILKSFGYVGNSVYMIKKILNSPDFPHGKMLYITDYPPIEVKAWADLIAEKSRKSPPMEIPLPALSIIAVIGDFLKYFGWNNPPLTSFRLNNLMTDMVYDTSELEKICGQLPYSIYQGIDRTLDWLSRNK